MIDIHLKYQATIFVNAEEIIPTPDIINPLLEIFRDKNLIPSTYYQVGPSSPTPRPRLRFSTSDSEWAVSFATHRIDVDKNAIDPKGSNLGELPDFCLNATNLFERVLNKYSKRANRLALNSNSLLEEMIADKLAMVYSKLFTPPQFYKDNSPFEWDWRSVSQYPMEIADLTDTLNVITVIKRVRGELGDQTSLIKFDRIQLSFDINTTDQNNDYRFDLSHIKSYFQSAPELHNTLSKHIQEYINA